MHRLSRFIIAALCICAALVPVTARAEDVKDDVDIPTLKIALEPSNLRLSLNPGDNYSGSFKVKNLGDIPYDVDIYAEPYQVEDYSYDVDFDTNNIFTQISRWVTFEKTAYHLEPRDIVSVPFSISVPKNAAGGGQYAAIFAEVKDVSETTQVRVDRRVGILVYSSVSGTANRSGRVEFTAPDFLQLTNSPTFFETAINDGNVDFDATTRLELSNLFTGDLAADFGTAPRIILPETTRSLEYRLDDLPIGFYRLSRVAEVHGEVFESSQVIFICPLPLLIAIILTFLALLALLIRLTLRSRHRRNRSRRNTPSSDDFPPLTT